MSGDLHCHTRLSDGSLGIDDLIVLAKKRGVTTIAITDHDCLAGTVRGKIIGDRHGIKVIPGVEISAVDKKSGRRAHLLCYLPDSPDRLEGLCRRNLVAVKKAAQYMILKAAQKYPITPEFVIKCAAGSTNIYKQHIMQALCESGLTDKICGGLYKELFSKGSPGNIIVEPVLPDVREVLLAILDAGGIPVLTSPGRFDTLDLIDELCELGLCGVEVWSPFNDEEYTVRLEAKAKEKKLLMIGGSNFHGMYGTHTLSIGSYTTPESHLHNLLSFKSRRKRQQKNRLASAADN